MNWTNFPMFALFSGLLWLIGLGLIDLSIKRNYLDWLGRIIIIAGLGLMIVFVGNLWVNLGRPPMRTLGETRLWYALFLPVIGLVTYFRWKYKWFIHYAIFLAILFLFINYMHPETYEKTLCRLCKVPGLYHM